MAREVKYEIKEHVGVLSENAKGWKKEINIVSWNDNNPKYDIRDWNQEHDKMSKGITLTKEQLIELKKILDNMEQIV